MIDGVATDAAHAAIRFSIVSPSWNQGAYIAETLQSIVEQGYPSLEHIVVDGASRDNTVEVLRDYAARYALSWISEPDNGLYDALNKALARARGEWIGWINCDDLYPPGLLQAAAAAIAAHPDVDIICADAEVFTRDDDGRDHTAYVDRHYRGATLDASAENLRITHLNACFFRKALLDRIGPFDTRYRILGDRDYLFRIMQLAPRCHHLERIGCRYRAHPESLTMSEVSSARRSPVAGAVHAMWPETERLCADYLARSGIPSNIRRWCARRLARRTAREAARGLLGGEFTRFSAALGDGFRHHPAWSLWFAGALLRGLLDGRARGAAGGS